MTLNFFSFLLNNVIVAVNKHNTILYSPDSPPLNSRVKNKTSLNFFSALEWKASIRIIKQNIRENIVQYWF